MKIINENASSDRGEGIKVDVSGPSGVEKI